MSPQSLHGAQQRLQCIVYSLHRFLSNSVKQADLHTEALSWLIHRTLNVQSDITQDAAGFTGLPCLSTRCYFSHICPFREIRLLCVHASA